MRKTSFTILLLFTFDIIATIGMFAQFSQQGSKLVGTGAVGNAQQGYSVSLSSDGNTAIVGGIHDNGSAGAAWIWTRSGGVWTQQGSKLVGTGSVGDAQQGWSVALSSDGNTAIVGGIEDSSGAGAAWVWISSGGVWTQQGNKLVGSGAVNPAYQGTSVALSADGNTAIVGGDGGNSGVGAAWIWTRSGGVWTQQGSKLVGSGAVGAGMQGHSVSLSSDGNTAIVGGVHDNPNYGATWIWTRSDGVWTQQGSKLFGTGAVGSSSQGQSVALSSDGNTAFVGGNEDSNYVGATWAWTRSGGVWTQQGNKLVGSGAIGPLVDQGLSVSLSANGDTAIVGGYYDNNYAGATWVWTRSGGAWTQLGSKLVGTGAVGGAYQGQSVSISADGSTAIVGGNVDSNYAGAAWIFVTPNAPMPVELTSFSAKSQGLNIELEWRTATEVNNAGFDIDRQPANSTQWTKIGSVVGAGTSNAPHSYSFTDNLGSAGTYSYRLKQIDHNGTFVYSQAVRVTLAVPKVLALSQNYPEPFNPSTTIQFTVPSNGRALLRVFNVLGQEVATLFDGEATAGTYHQLQFNGSNLASGIYFSWLEFGGKMQLKKMLLLK